MRNKRNGLKVLSLAHAHAIHRGEVTWPDSIRAREAGISKSLDFDSTQVVAQVVEDMSSISQLNMYSQVVLTGLDLFMVYLPRYLGMSFLEPSLNSVSRALLFIWTSSVST